MLEEKSLEIIEDIPIKNMIYKFNGDLRSFSLYMNGDL